jgi:hypothetical protein
MANSRDFTGKNRKFTGTKGIVTPKGTTGQRVGEESGELRFNTTTELMEYYDGNQWKPIDAPPTISSISTSDATGSNTVLNADGSTLHTITITGGNFGIGLTVKFIGNTGTEYAAGNTTRVSNSSITCKTTASMGTSDDPYDIIVTNASGLAATLEDAFTFNAPPVFTVASGTLGQVFNGQTISGTTLNAGATDAEGNTITFTIISGSLPGSGLTISSSTGAITGTLSGTPSLGNYPFVVRAATTEGTVERQFSIQVIAFPGVVATGGTVTTDGNFKIHTFTGPGTFTVTSGGSPTAPNAVDYLVVGGGGGAGNASQAGGGGAGGFRLSNATGMPAPATSPLATPVGLTVSASPGSFPITVGAGGPAGSTTGSSSIFSTITSAGGGRGGPHNTSGSSGGSGGGGCGGPGPGSSTSFPGGTGNTPPVSPPQGNNGGGGFDGQVTNQQGGGGGGAGAVGALSSSDVGGAGGIGSFVLATGFAGANGTPGPVPGVRYFAGGGAGSSNGSPVGTFAGGAGGGGTGAPGPGSPGGTAGGTNTGGGGGAGTNQSSGGSGIVIIRYRYQ